MNYRRLCSISMVVVLVTFLATTVTGDSIKLDNGIQFNSVQVTGFSKGSIVFVTSTGNTVKKDIKVVHRITLDGTADFNNAETYRVANKREKAIACYHDAKATAQSDWLRALINARLVQTDIVKTRRKKAENRSTTSPLKRKPIGPLSSPEALADLIGSAPKPPNYSNMTTLQREEKKKEFSDKLKTWWASHDPVERKVEWVLRVKDVVHEKTSEKFVLLGESRNLIAVKVAFSADQKNTLQTLSKGDFVILAGTIVRWKKERNEFSPYGISYELNGKSLKKGGDWSSGHPKSSGVVRFYGVTHSAQDVVYVIDKSGSMKDTFANVREAVKQSVLSLSPDQRFHIIFYSSGVPKENPPKKLVFATEKSTRKLEKFLRTVEAKGQTDIIPAIKRAFKVLKGDRKRGKLIYLLTDGVFPDNEAVLRTIARENKDKKVHIDTFLYGTAPPAAVVVMTKIAKNNSGRYTFIRK